MSYIIKTIESSVKNLVKTEYEYYLSTTLTERAAIGESLLASDLNKTKAFYLAGKIMSNQQITIQTYSSILRREVTNADANSFLIGHGLRIFMIE